MSVPVTGPDGNEYEFPDGTDKNAAIGYFKKKGIGLQSPPAPSPVDLANSELSKQGLSVSPMPRPDRLNVMERAGTVMQEGGPEYVGARDLPEAQRKHVYADVYRQQHPEYFAKPQVSAASVVRGGLEALTPGGAGTAAYDLPVGGYGAAKGIAQGNKKEFYEGGAQALEGVGTALSVGIGGQIVEAPLRTSAALLGYQFGSEAAAEGVKRAGGSPEAQRFAAAATGVLPLGYEGWHMARESFLGKRPVPTAAAEPATPTAGPDAQAATPSTPLVTPELQRFIGKKFSLGNQQVELTGFGTGGQVKFRFTSGREGATHIDNLKPPSMKARAKPAATPVETPAAETPEQTTSSASPEDAMEEARRRAVPQPEPTPAPNQVPLEARASTKLNSDQQARVASLANREPVTPAKESTPARLEDAFEPRQPGESAQDYIARIKGATQATPSPTPAEFGHGDTLLNAARLSDATRDAKLSGPTNKQRRAAQETGLPETASLPTPQTTPSGDKIAPAASEAPKSAPPSADQTFLSRDAAISAGQQLHGEGNFVIKSKTAINGKTSYQPIPKATLPTPSPAPVSPLDLVPPKEHPVVPPPSTPLEAPPQAPQAKPAKPSPQAIRPTPSGEPVQAQKSPVKDSQAFYHIQADPKLEAEFSKATVARKQVMMAEAKDAIANKQAQVAVTKRGPQYPDIPRAHVEEISSLVNNSFGTSPLDTRMAARKSLLEAYRELVKRKNTDPMESIRRLTRGEDPLPLLSDGWVSKLYQKAKEKMTGPMTADQLRSTLINAGVSPEEMKWTGTDDFLRDHPRIAKPDLLAHLEENQVKLNEVTKGKGGENSEITRERADLRVQLDSIETSLRHNIEGFNSHLDEQHQDILAGYVFATAPTEAEQTRARTQLESAMYPGAFNDITMLADRRRELENRIYDLDADGSSDAQYESYTLPGGDNYREVLLQLPEKGEIQDYGKDAQGRNYAYEHLTDRGGFRSAHFDEPNVVAHLRLKDRVDSAGKKTLFVEEVQSDWHEQGNKYGYRQPTPSRNAVEIERSLNVAIGKAVDQLGVWDEYKAGSITVPEIAQQLKGHNPTLALRIEQDLSDQKILNQNQNAPPPAPFRSNWHELAMKKALHLAAKEGYDQLAWTTGKTQAERYSLTRHVDRLGWDPETSTLSGRTTDGRVFNDHVTREELPNYVGRDAAEQVLAANGLTISITAEMGGTSHTRLYDEMIPQFMNKYGKKWGARVGKAEFPFNDDKSISDTLTRTTHAADFDKGSVSAHSIPITESMRQSVLEGQSMFLRDQSRRIITDKLIDRARTSVEASGTGVEWSGDDHARSWGIAWFKDPVTGSNLAMELRDASSPERVRAHVEASRAEFTSAKSKAATTQSFLVPPSIRNVIDNAPAVLRQLFRMDPERAVRTIASNTDPLLRDAASSLGVGISAEPYSKLTNSLGVFEPSSNVIGLRTRSALRNFLSSKVGGWTLNEIMAHELGHAIWQQLRGLDPSVKIAKFYPDTVRNHVARYVKRGVLSISTLRHEAFAESFRDWYMGNPGDARGFEKVLQSDPKVWASVRDLQGKGSLYSPGDVRTAGEIAYGAIINEPNFGLPAGQTFRDLLDTVKEKVKDTFTPSDLARGFIRKNYAKADIELQRYYSSMKDDINRLDSYTQSDLRKWMDIGEGRTPNTLAPADTQAMQWLRTQLDAKRDIIQAERPGTFDHFITNYFSHVWERPGVAASKLNSLLTTRRSLQGNKGFVKARFYQFFSDGLDAGLKPVTNNPVKMQLATLHQMDRYIAGLRTFKELKTEKLLKFASSRNDLPLDKSHWVPLDDPIFNPAFKYFDPSTGNPAPGISRTGRYYAPPDMAKTINNFLSPGLRGQWWFDPVRSMGNTLNMSNLGLSAYHGMFSAFSTGAWNMGLGLEKLSTGSASGLKDIVRGFAFPVSVLQELRFGSAIRSAMIDPQSHPALARMADTYISAGGRYGQDAVYKNNAIDRFWKDWANHDWAKAGLHGFGAFVEWSSKPIMEKMVPNLKAAAFARRGEFLLDKLTSEGQPQHVIMREMDRLADSVDNIFGQMVYDNTFWNRAHKDIAMLSLRSVGWNAGNVRDIGTAAMNTAREGYKATQGQAPKLPFQVGFMVSLTALTAFYGAAYSYLHGQTPEDLKDYFFPRTGEIGSNGKPVRMNFATYVKDWIGVPHDPKSALTNKLHPLLQQFAEMIQNKDYYGTEIRHTEDPIVSQLGQVLKYEAKAFLPFSATNAMSVRNSGGGVLDSLSSAVGITPAPQWVGQSPAERYAAEKARRHYEAGPHTTEEFEKRQQFAQIRSRYYAGKMPFSALLDEVKAGRLRDSDLDRLVDERGMPALPRATLHLTADEFLETWKLADPTERSLLREQLYDQLDKVDNLPAIEQPAMRKRFLDIMSQSGKQN